MFLHLKKKERYCCVLACNVSLEEDDLHLGVNCEACRGSFRIKAHSRHIVKDQLLNFQLEFILWEKQMSSLNVYRVFMPTRQST